MVSFLALTEVDTPAPLREGEPGRVQEASAESPAGRHVKRALEHQFGTGRTRAHTKIRLYVNNLVHFQTKSRIEIHLLSPIPALEFVLHVTSS